MLVDRLWPRGVTKADAHLDEWLKEAAPSSELRRWYDHDVRRFEEFARRYRAELRRPPDRSLWPISSSSHTPGRSPPHRHAVTSSIPVRKC